MSVDYNEKLQYLRELHEIIRRKEVPPAELCQNAGMKLKPRIKDIESEIVKVRKLISSQIKEKIREEVDADLTKVAEENNMTLEEFKERQQDELLKERQARKGRSEKEKAQAVVEGRTKKLIARGLDEGDVEIDNRRGDVIAGAGGAGHDEDGYEHEEEFDLLH